MERLFCRFRWFSWILTMYDSSTAQGGSSSRFRRCRLPALVQGKRPLPLVVADASGIWQCRGSNC